MKHLKRFKPHWKRIAAAALSVVMLLSILPFSVFAAEQTVVKSVGEELMYFYNGDKNNPLDYFHTYKKVAVGGEADGYFAYCLSHHDKSPDANGAVYTKGDPINDPGVLFIFNHSILRPGLYSSRKYMTGEENKDFYLTQVAVNTYLNQTSIWEGGDPKCDADPSMVTKAKQLIADARKAATQPAATPSITAVPKEQWFSVNPNGQYWETGWFEVSFVGDLEEYDTAMKSTLNGVQLVNSSNQVVTSLTASDKKFKLRIATNQISQNGDVKFLLSGSFKKVSAVEYRSNADVQPVTINKLERQTNPQDNDILTAHLNAVGNAKLVKVSEDGAVKDIPFKVTDPNGYSADVKTGLDGTWQLNNLLEGQYTVTELTPDKYVPVSSQKVTIQAGQTSTVTFSNKLKKFRVDGLKKDGETNTAQGDASLDGAVYGLYRGNTLVERMTTSNGGKFSSGTYVCGDNWTIKEISPSPGYNLDQTVYPVGAEPGNFTVEYNTVSKTVNEQVKKGKARLYKFTDERNPDVSGGGDQIKKPEAGAQFQIWLASAGSYASAKPSERCTLTTDTNGQAETPLLPYGEYIGHQTKGQAGTAFVDDFRFAIQEQDQTLHYYIENPQVKSTIRILKVDAETGERIPLAGAGFKVRDMQTHQFIVQHVPYPSDEWIDTFYTNADGWLMMPEMLPIGDYQAIEVMAPYGYVLDSTPIDFHVDGLGTPVTVTKPNKAQKGTIGVIKTGELFSSVSQTGEGEEAVYQPVYANGILSGAEYKVYADENIITPDGTLREAKGTLVDTLTTGTKDKTVPLYLGKYKVVETKAPYGYVLNEEPQYITLTYAGQYVEVTQASTSFTNERQKLQLDLLKELEEDELFELGALDAYRNIRFGLYANEEIRANDGTVIPKDGLIEIVGLNPQLQASFRSDLPFGSYYVQEIATDNHYVLNGEKYLVSFTYHEQTEQTVHITVNEGEAIQNTLKRGSVMGLKVDHDGFELQGALIGLFRANETAFTEDTALMTCLSNEIGVFGFFDVPYGDYLIAEIAPPEGFLLTDTVIPVSITEDGQTIEVELENQIITGSVQTVKTDADYPELHLSGAGFTVYRDVDGNKEYNPEMDIKVDTLSEGTGDAQGSYLLTNLAYGGYFLKETQAPEGYLLDDTAYYFKIEEDGATVNIETQAGQGFINQAQTGSLKITKTADDGVIENIPFRVTGETITGIPYEETFYTDANGEIQIDNLRIGTYTVEELNGDGSKYILPPKQTVEIECDNLSELTFHNKLIPVIPVPPTGDTALPAFLCLAIAAGGLICLLRRKQNSR